MKIFKKSLFLCFVLLAAALCFLGNAQKIDSSAAAATQTYTYEKYIKLSSATMLNDKNITQDSLDKNQYIVVSNNSVSLSLNIFAYKFDFQTIGESISAAPENLMASMSEPISLDSTEGDISFAFNDIVYNYYYVKGSDRVLLYTTQNKSVLKYTIMKDNVSEGFYFDGSNLSFVSNITCNLTANETVLNILVYDGQNRYFTFVFEKPITEFFSHAEPIVNFVCTGQDVGDYASYEMNWLPPERTYKTVTIEFFKNYTENNPLYITINKNGFRYFYEIYTKDAKVYLKYNDADAKENQISTQAYDIFNGLLSTSQSFDITFDQIGRYEIEIYDRTYNPELSLEANLLNQSNYYKTSFYIYDNEKTYQNIYTVAESYENGLPTSYLVTEQSKKVIVNTDIRATFKNLYKLSLADMKKIEIVVEKTIFGSTHITTAERYTYDNSATLKNCYDNQQDFYLEFSEDAEYLINIYFGNSDDPINSNNYVIVKQPRLWFEYGTKPAGADGQNTTNTIIGDDGYFYYEETQRYKKTIKDLQIEFRSKMSLNLSYVNAQGTPTYISGSSANYNKTYYQKVSIFFGIPEVDIYKYTRMITEGGDQKAATTLDIKFNSVGETNVTVIKDGKVISRLVFKENENKVLSFSDYGEYTIQIQDEMGSTASKSFSYQKGLNTSAIALIALSSFLVLAIVVFVIKSRSKVATR